MKKEECADQSEQKCGKDGIAVEGEEAQPDETGSVGEICFAPPSAFLDDQKNVSRNQRPDERIPQPFAENGRREQFEKARQDIKLRRSVKGEEIAMRNFAIGDAHGPDEDRALIINVEVALDGKQQKRERERK